MSDYRMTRELNISALTSDWNIQGVEIVDTVIILSGSNGTSQPNHFYRLGISNGTLLNTIDQNSITGSGIRDLAAIDGLIYGGENDTIWRWDSPLANRVRAFTCADINPPRGLAAQHSSTGTIFWAGDNTAPVKKVSSTGTVLATYTNSRNISGIACSPISDTPVWFVSTDNSVVWLSRLDPNSTTIASVTSLSIPSGYRSAGACIYTNPTDDSQSIVVVLTDPVNYQAKLRFYAIPSTFSYATMTGTTTGTIAAGDSISVPVTTHLPLNKLTFRFAIQQLSAPGSRTVQYIELRREVSVTEPTTLLPTKFSVDRAYPNPFNSRSNVRFALPRAGLVQIFVYDCLGRSISNSSRYLTAGFHSQEISLVQQASGIYFLKIQFERETSLQRIVLIR